MKLSRRILINVAGLFAMVSLGTYAGSHWVLKEAFSEVEATEAREDWLEAKAAINNQVQALHDRSIDWSQWNDAFNFVKTRDPEFVASNLTEGTAISMKMDLLAFFDLQGKAAGELSIERFSTIKKPSSSDVWKSLELKNPETDAPKFGLIWHQGQVAAISARPVTPNDVASPRAGWLVFFKYLDRETVRGLTRESGSLTIEPRKAQDVQPVGTIPVYAIDDDYLAVLGSLRGLKGESVGRLRLITPRSIVHKGDQTLGTLLSVLLGFAAVFTFIFHGLLRQLILKRLNRLRDEVGQVNLQSGQGYITTTGSDEISEVGQAMTKMLSTIADYTQELEAQRRSLSMTNDDLERQVIDRTLQLVEANSVLQNALDGICRLNHEGDFIESNPQAGRILRCETLVGRSFFEFLPQSSQDELRRALVVLRSQDRVDVELESMARDGSLAWLQVVLLPARDRDATVHSIHVFIKDVTESRELHERIQHQAFYDPLTGLVNRTLFQEKLENCLNSDEGMVGVMFIDLDNFKYVNDSMGHDFGDLLLIEVANRITLCARPGDVVARMGGDEFSVLLPELQDSAEAHKVASSIIEALAEPVRIFGRDVFATASVGLCVSNKEGAKVSELLRSADTAMYEAKANGKANYSTFDDSMSEKIVERIKLESGLRSAIMDHEISVLFQPIVDLNSGRITGAETLARWNSPTLGFVSPARFIPIAEDTGLIIPLGASVLDDACRAAADWRRRLDPHFQVNVNLSLRQLLESDLIDAVRLALDFHQLDPAGLHLEITESLAVRDYERVIGQLKALKSLGVGLAIDDFGTGYSSLSYLQRLPIDTVKIDRSFVTMLGIEQAPTAIIMAIITLCRAMGFKVVAEGVETPEQVIRLGDLGCHAAQGFLFSKPISAAAMEALIRNGLESNAA